MQDKKMLQQKFKALCKSAGLNLQDAASLFGKSPLYFSQSGSRFAVYELLFEFMRRGGAEFPWEDCRHCGHTNLFDDLDQEIYEENTRKAIDEAGGCSQCGDLNGYSCTCEDEDELDEDACGYCHRTDSKWLLNGLCETCHEDLMREHIDNPYT